MEKQKRHTTSGPTAGGGTPSASTDQLFAQVYEELKVLARRQRRRWHGNHTINTTSLIHEAYLKLVDRGSAEVGTRAHFFALAAQAMRQILINYARERGAQKRGGHRRPLPLDESMAPASLTLAPDHAAELLSLHGALHDLEQVDARQVRVVECRFFGGMSVDETAAALGISPRTVKRDWAVAQAWLNRRMEETDG